MRRNRSIVHLLFVLTLACTTIAALGGTPANAGGGIVATRVVGGLNGPAAFTFLDDGRIVYAERGTGQIHIYNPETKSDSRFFTVPGVNGDGERGALGVAVSPGWPHPRAIYVYATRSTSSGLRNQIVKVTRANGHARMRVLVSQPASSSPYHNGGRILFGPDGMLYAIIGDGHDSSNSQDMSGNLRGKILRMTPAGGVPSDNPIAGSRIFAFGIRNSYGFTFDAQTGSLWETENGPECNDEINLIVGGGNFGWGPSENCSGDSPGQHEQQRSDAAAPAEALVRRHDRHHGRCVLRRMRPGSRRRGRPVLRRREHRGGAPRRVERGSRRRVGQRHRRAGHARRRLLDGDGAERTHLLQRRPGDLPAGAGVRRTLATTGHPGVRC